MNYYYDPAPFEPTAPTGAPITVSMLTQRVASILSGALPMVWVSGEIRGFTRAASGHWYFTLKDERAEVRCAMFAGANRRVGFAPKTGDKVVVRGKATLYQARGEFQLVVDAMREAGLGLLYEAFLRLKQKLQNEGLFDAQRKKPISPLNFRIGVVTSLQAAALRDVITTLMRRAPYAKIIVYPCAVQGEEAPREIIAALHAAEARREVDVLLLVRGGGSLQDLWAFNDEGVARTIAALSLPVIVGVGHESDSTIADWVADVRAATPTAAAELVTVPMDNLLAAIGNYQDAMREQIQWVLQDSAQRLDWAQGALIHPRERLQRDAERLATLKDLLINATQKSLQAKRHAWALTHQALLHQKPACDPREHRAVFEQIHTLFQQRLQTEKARWQALQVVLEETDPQVLLARGYAMVTDEAGAIVSDAKAIEIGDQLTVHLHQAQVTTRVEAVHDKH